MASFPFLLVAQHRSFTRAAGALFITPSGLSLLIRELENQLGASLFERTTRQVLLTRAGSQLLNTVERLRIHWDHRNLRDQ
jgi:LysR family transcriptional regulator, carnitine catabolism transcriptional activator